MILVDTSVWIEFLRGYSNDKVSILEALLEDGDAYLCGVVYAEICFGAQDPQQFKKYQRFFSELPFLELREDWHLNIAKMGHDLRLKGHRPFIADLLIAYTALSHGVPLLTLDKDFAPFEILFGLRLV